MRASQEISILILSTALPRQGTKFNLEINFNKKQLNLDHFMTSLVLRGKMKEPCIGFHRTKTIFCEEVHNETTKRSAERGVGKMHCIGRNGLKKVKKRDNGH